MKNAVEAPTGRTRNCIGILLLLSVAPLAAQSVMSGIVRADSTGRPLPGVEVVLLGTDLKTVTGPTGRYLLEAVPPGRRMVLFRLVGYLPARSEVLLRPGDTTRANAVLIASTVVLDPIVVRAREPFGEGSEGFEARRRLGFGKFYDSLMLRRSEHLRLDDLLRRQGAVEVGQTSVDGAPARVAFNTYRRDPLTGKLNCPMQVYYNGAKVGVGGQYADTSRWFDLGLFDVASLESIEVYRSAGQVPGMYSGPTADCGVILLWPRK